MIDNKISGINYDICETQADIFEYAASQYDFNNFVSLYMKSDFCKRAFDTSYSRFQLETVLECMDFILPEIGNQLKTVDLQNKIPKDVANWIGFIYRALYIRTNIPSAILLEKVSLDSLYRYYPGLHTIDEEMQLDIICKDKCLNEENYYE